MKLVLHMFSLLLLFPSFFNPLDNHSQILQTDRSLKGNHVVTDAHLPTDTRESAQGRALRHSPSCGKSFAQSLCYETSLSPRCRLAGNHFFNSVLGELHVLDQQAALSVCVAKPHIRKTFICSTLQGEDLLLETRLEATVNPKAGVSKGPPGSVCAVSVSFKQTNK